MRFVVIASVLAILFAASLADESFAARPKIPSLSCTLCQNVMGKLQGAMTSNVSVSAMQAKVQADCNKYFIQDWCAKNIVPRIPTIVGLIAKKSSPLKVCQSLRICKNKTKTFGEKLIAEKKGKGGNPYHGKGINCAICENVVNVLEGALTSNVTLERLQADLTKTCTTLGINTWCQKVFLPKLSGIFEKLKNKVPPSDVCKSIKLCRATRRNPFPANLAVLQSEFSVACEVCQAVITYTKNYIQGNHTQAAIAAALTKACNALPFAKDVCQQVLIPYVQQIVQGFIAKQDPLQICERIKICKHQEEEHVEPIGLSYHDYEEMLEREQKAKEQGEAVIGLSYHDYEEMLERDNEIVNEELIGMAYREVAEEEPVIGLSYHDYEEMLENENEMEDEEIIGLSYHDYEEMLEENEDVNGLAQLDIKCDLCIAILNYVKKMIGSNATEAAIRKALDQACAKLPFAQDICKAVIQPYVVQIVEAIIAKQNPAQICQKIKLCAAMASMNMKRDFEIDLRCGICTAILTYVKDVIGSDQSQAAIRKAISDACNKIPFAKNVCTAVIEPYLTDIINGFIAKQDPVTICTVNLRLCN